MAILPTNHLDQSIDQPDIIAAQDQKFVKNPNPYSVSNPHPKFGKDTNILNEQGHTEYPKMIYPHGKENAGVVAKNAEEEASILGGNAPEAKPIEPQQQKNQWS